MPVFTVHRGGRSETRHIALLGEGLPYQGDPYSLIPRPQPDRRPVHHRAVIALAADWRLRDPGRGEVWHLERRHITALGGSDWRVIAEVPTRRQLRQAIIAHGISLRLDTVAKLKKLPRRYRPGALAAMIRRDQRDEQKAVEAAAREEGLMAEAVRAQARVKL